MEDISEFLAQLFLEVDDNLLQFNIKKFFTAKNNEAIIVNNFVYHKKTSNDKTNSSRWVCRSCSASLSFVDDVVVKINGKKTVLDQQLKSYHSHSEISNEEVSQIMSYERIKQRALSENVPIQRIFEDEEISMAKAGKSTKEIADGMWQYVSKKSSFYRKNG